MLESMLELVHFFDFKGVGEHFLLHLRHHQVKVEHTEVEPGQLVSHCDLQFLTEGVQAALSHLFCATEQS